MRFIWKIQRSVAAPRYVCDGGHTGVCLVPLMITDCQFSLIFKALPTLTSECVQNSLYR